MINTNASNENTNARADARNDAILAADAALAALLDARRATAIAWAVYNRNALARLGDHQAQADAVRAAARAEGEALAAYAAAATAAAINA
jgi:hypothetical protein